MPKSFFDIVCLGSDLPGLLASALLAKQGYRTLVVTGEPLPSAQHGPPLLAVGDHSSPVVKAAFSSLGLTQEMRNRLKPLIPSYQVVLPGHRLDLGGRSPGTDEEVKRELPELCDQLDPLLDRLEQSHERLQALFDPPLVCPPTRWRERRHFAARLRLAGVAADLSWDDPFPGMELAHPLRLLFDAPIHFLTGADPATLGPLARSRLLGHLGRGISLLPGDRAALGDLLLQRLKTAGGVVRQGALPDGIALGWFGPAMLSFDRGREEIGCQLVLAALSLDQLVFLLPQGRKRMKIEQLRKDFAPSAYLATLRLKVAATLLPEALAPLAYCVGDLAAPLCRENLVQVWTGGGGDPRLLCASAILPAAELAEDGDRALQRLQRRLEEVLRGLLPYLDHHLVESGKLTREALLPLPALLPTGLRSLGPLAHRTPYRQILLASRQLLPALGLEGEFQAGVSTSLTVNGLLARRNLLPA
ncbi:MAG: hypothetical protein RBU45_03715 [Myxococcota bacterium]|nr:hypothetical protein [Myxococcota bacterium]